MPFKKYRYRREYLEKAIPKGFHKKLLILKGEVVGTIEYAPAESSGYPIVGKNIIVMNCVWVLRKAKMHNFGRLLVEDMVKSVRDVSGFATMALENHWSPWFKKGQLEKLGFTSIDSIEVTHRAKHEDRVFEIHLMWMPLTETAKPPGWNKQKILEGETFCMAHPLYRPQIWKGRILEAK
jgi:N-acetylglutamate synthase-like GNAT family acetyltransferase